MTMRCMTSIKGGLLNAQVPWEDLRYIFGEIMYGGHIVEDWDRRLAAAYLLKYFQESLSDGLTLFPGFATPPTNLSYVQVRVLTAAEGPCARVTGSALGCPSVCYTLR